MNARSARLPPAVQSRIDDTTSAISQSELLDSVARLSSAYRHSNVKAVSPIRSSVDATAYLVFRFPATFAAASSVLSELAALRPHLWPDSIVDVGAGPGTASLAACEVWPVETLGDRHRPLSRTLHLIEPNLDLSRFSVEMLGVVTGRETAVSVRQSRLGTDFTVPSVALSIASYVFGELSQAEQTSLIRTMWESSVDSLVVIEPGTPAGFRAVQSLTRELARMNAHILAPAPLGWNYLAGHEDWLHFSVRVPRSRMHVRLKAAELGYEDEKFSYVIASRHPGRPYAGRVVRHPQIRPGHIRLTICSKEPLREYVISRRGREAWRLARGLAWGDRLTESDLAVLAAQDTS